MRIYNHISPYVVKVKCIDEIGSGCLFPSDHQTYIMTARHCLTGKTDQERHFVTEDVTVQRLLDGEVETRFKIENHFLHTECDLGLIAIETVDGIKPLGYIEAEEDDKVLIYGYPKYLEDEPSPAQLIKGTVHFVRPKEIEITTDHAIGTIINDMSELIEGLSGAGVYRIVDGRIFLVGILTRLRARYGGYQTVCCIPINKYNELLENIGMSSLPFYSMARDYKEEDNLSEIERIRDSSSEQKEVIVTFQAPKYEVSDTYIRRRVFSARDDLTPSYYRIRVLRDLIDVAVEEKRIVLLGDAGTGKSVELNWVAAYFSQEGSKFTPIMTSLNKYVDQKIGDLLPAGWETIPENQLMIILDGFDEIQSQYKFDAMQQIKLFVDQHPKTRIIVGCRTNFYNSSPEEGSGILHGFSPYILENFSAEDQNTYINGVLGSSAVAFYQGLLDAQLEDIASIPFYLAALVKIYLHNPLFPLNKSGIFEMLLTDSFISAKDDSLTPKPNAPRAIEGLEQLALYLVMLGKNYLTDDEFREAFPEQNIRDQITSCVWVIQKGNSKTLTISFEHNSFQEYLAARWLYKQPTEMIKDLVSIDGKVNPSWVNTLAFIVSLSRNKDLIEWVMEHQPYVAVKFESDKFEEIQRNKLFVGIYTNYKVKQVWLNNSKFNFRELALFGDTRQNIDFLITEISDEQHFTTIYNAINLLGNMRSSDFIQNEKICNLLVKWALDVNSRPEVRKSALMALANLQFYSPATVNAIASKLRYSELDWVRYGLYYYLAEGPFLSEYIDVFLEGITYVRNSSSCNESRLLNELWQLREGLQKVLKPEAVLKIIRYLKKTPSDFHEIFSEQKVKPFVNNMVVAYYASQESFPDIMDFYCALVDLYHWGSEERALTDFFDATQTRSKALDAILENKSDGWLHYFAALTDQEALGLITQMYLDLELNDQDIWAFHNSLATFNGEFYVVFNNMINGVSNGKFVIQTQADYEDQKRTRLYSDVGLLFNKEMFLKSIKQVYLDQEKEELNNKDLFNIEVKQYELYSRLALRILRDITKDDQYSVTYDIVVREVEKWNWDLFCIDKLYNYMTNNPDLVLCEMQTEWVTNWCYKNLGKVNFRKALKSSEPGQSSTSWLAIWLWYSLRRFNLDYPEKVLLDMISFDWLNGGGQMQGIQYLENRIDAHKFTARVLRNLEDGITDNSVLENHIDYCRRHGFVQVVPITLEVLKDHSRGINVRRTALDALLELSHLEDNISLLRETGDDFRWEIIQRFVSIGLLKGLSEYLVEVIKDVREEDKSKLIAAGFLVKLQHIEGVKFFLEWIKENQSMPEELRYHSPLSMITNVQAIPTLLDLLYISFSSERLSKGEERLYSVVSEAFSSIALASDKGYNEVVNSITNFIISNTSLPNVNFLYVFLERIEQSKLTTKQESSTIKDAYAKLLAVKLSHS